MNRKQAAHDRTVLPRIQELKAAGRSRREIAAQLQQDGVPTARRGGKWTHIAVGRILDRAARTPPEEARPLPPPPEPPSAQAEPPRALAPQLQKIEAQIGSAVDQMGARLQNKLGTVERQVDERLTALTRLSTWLWFRPAAVGGALCLAVGLGAWVYTEAVASRIDRQRQTLAALQVEIARQQATLRELEKRTWGVAFVDGKKDKFITWPGHYKPPYKSPDPAYANKWVAILAEE